MNIEHWKPDDTTTRTGLKGEDSYTSRRDENFYNEMKMSNSILTICFKSCTTSPAKASFASIIDKPNLNSSFRPCLRSL